MDGILTESPARSVWNGWGDPARARPLPAGAWTLLERHLGVTRTDSHPPVPLADLDLNESRLTPEADAALAAVVGPDNIRQDRRSRAEHLGGKSYLDLYRARRGDVSHAPDAVVLPADAAEVAAVLDVCRTHRLAAIPFGGGTSVVGGVEPDAGHHDAVIHLDLRRLDAIVDVDPESRTATLQAGMRGPAIEAALQPHGFTLGHYPQSHQQATLGGYVATRSAGQASTGYGRIDDNVLGATIVTPRGTLTLGGRTPASAAGPGLLDLVVGSEGALGVITEATLRIHPLPTTKRYAVWSFPDLPSATAALRDLAQLLGPHVMPDVCRLSDPDETAVNLGMGGRPGRALLRYAATRHQPTPCLAIFVWEGQDARDLRRRARRAATLAAGHGGIRMPATVARHWERHRFLGPYGRDELMDHGVFVETLETATTWRNLMPLYAAVRSAILAALADLGTPGLVQTHVSHVYPSGASLYFTYLAREAADPPAQWSAVKSAAGRAIAETGGTITHHHGVGTAHLDGLATEIGPLGTEILRAVKAALDPDDLLNPGKLIPAAP